MSNLPQDTEECLFNPGLSSFSSPDAEPSITFRERRSEIRAIKSAMAEQGQTMAQHSQILTSLSTQLSQLVDLFSATTVHLLVSPRHRYIPLPRDESLKSFLHLMERLRFHLVNPSPWWALSLLSQRKSCRLSLYTMLSSTHERT